MPRTRATLRHLVTHTGGWLGDCSDFGKGDDALRGTSPRWPSPRELTPLGEIGITRTRASTVLGRLIEVVTGKTYEAACASFFSSPLGMAGWRLLQRRRGDHPPVARKHSRPLTSSHASSDPMLPARHHTGSAP